MGRGWKNIMCLFALTGAVIVHVAVSIIWAIYHGQTLFIYLKHFAKESMCCFPQSEYKHHEYT